MTHLRVLGSIELRDGEGRELRDVLAQPKRLALLTHLAIAPQEFCRRDSLVALFWPELDASHARNALSQALAFLRQGMEPSIIRTRGTEDVGVDRRLLQCDAAGFLAAVAADQLDEALALYRGDLLDGLFVRGSPPFDEWLAAERERFRRAAARVARRAAEQHERERSFTTAVSAARRAIALSDMDERAVRELIALLDRLGDRAGAVHAFERFERRLASEYEAEPSPETRRLIAEVRSRGPDAERQSGPARRSPSDSGYALEGELGRGGMSVVYLARDLKHGRQVAMKVMRPAIAAGIGAARFLAEIRVTARLAHPHILPLLDSGEGEHGPYYVTPYLPGESLRERLRAAGRLSVAEATRIGSEVAEALDYAHRLGVVHCDIKPENILLADGHAVVADFGIARAVSAASRTRGNDDPGDFVVGTRGYMSPEQASSYAMADPRSDIYSLGCVLYEMVAGVGPQAQASPAPGVGDPAASAPSPLVRRRPGVPPALAALVSRCLASDPGQRPESMAAVLAILDGASQAQQARVRRRVLAGAAAMVAVIAMGGGLLSRRPGGSSPAARDLVRRIAVMPLIDGTPGANEGFLAAAFHEDLVRRLATMSALDVRSRESTRRFTGPGVSRAGVATALEVGTLVEGTFSHTDDSVWLDVRVARVRPSEHELLHRRFARARRESEQLHGEVASAIAAAVGVKPTRDEWRRLQRSRQADPRAAAAVAMGTHAGSRRSTYDLDACEAAARKAIAVDSTYAPAWSLLADCVQSRVWFAGVSPHEAYAVSRRAAERAIALDSGQANAFASLAFEAAAYLRDWARSEKFWRRALDEDPGSSRAYAGYAFLLSVTGRHEAAVEVARRREKLDPLDLSGIQHVAMILYLARRYEDGLEQVRRAIAMDSTYFLAHDRLHWLLDARGDHEGALEAAATAVRRASPDDLRRRGFLAYALGRAGRMRDARAALESLLAMHRSGRYVPPYAIAAAYLGLGEHAQAIEWLERGFEDRDPDMFLLSVKPLWDPLRRDPRFRALLARMKYPPPIGSGDAAGRPRVRASR